MQSTATRHLRRKSVSSRIMVTLCGLALVLATIPLLAIMISLISRGAKWWSVGFFTSEPAIPSLSNPNAVGGFANAIVGTIVIIGIATLAAVPIGLIAGLLIAESKSQFSRLLRSTAEVMTGLPSILLGIFAYWTIVLGGTRLGITFPAIGFSGLAGALAIAVLMIPIIIKASEASLEAVPTTVREAGLALGARKGVVARRVVMPTALQDVTSVLLRSLAPSARRRHLLVHRRLHLQPADVEPQAPDVRRAPADL